jgi:hypothetical protein
MRAPGEDREFNTPQEMLVRATFLVCLVAFASGIIVTLAAAVARDFRLLALGIALLCTGALTRNWLSRKGRFESAEMSFREFARPGSQLDPAHVAELSRLLREWEELERLRGSPRFDPWAVQSIRHDIRVMIEQDPALGRLFDGRQRMG